MKDRLVTVAGGLLALALVVMLLVPVPRESSDRISRPLSNDRGAQGLAGLERWLSSGGVPTEALRLRYTELAGSLERVPRGNLLIVSLPQRTRARPDEIVALREWLEVGNSVLVLAALGDVPRWRTVSQPGSTGDFVEGLGFELETITIETTGEPAQVDDDAARDREVEALMDEVSGTSIALVPRAAHPVTRDVRRVAARSTSVLDLGWDLVGLDGQRAVLALLADPSGGTALWEARVGKGRMWLSRYADLFGNASLGEADNARLLANVVAAALGPNGRVVLDDMHQGLTDLYDPRAFFADPRLLATLGFIGGFWLLYLVGSSRRLALPRPAAPRYFAAELARAMGDLFVRRIGDITLARRLFAHFFDDFRARHGLPTNGEPVWAQLLGMSQLERDDVRELRSLYERTAAGTRVDTIALARMLQRTRNSLS